MRNNFEDRFFQRQLAGTYDRIVWRNVLSRFLHWPPEKVDAKIAALDDLLARTGDFHYHETALWYVAILLIPEDVRQRIDVFEANRLSRAMEGVVFPDGEPDRSVEEAESFNWDAAFDRVNAFWEQFRFHLDQV